MLALTSCMVAVVYAGTEDTFTRVGATGRTALTLIDHQRLPALATYNARLAAGIRPAAFGLLELTDALLIVPSSIATFSFRGMATSRWTDVHLMGTRAWAITPAFTAGIGPSLHITVAPGFTAHVEGLADIHAVIALDSLWTASCLIANAIRLGSPVESPLRGPRIHACIARSIGTLVASVEVGLPSGQEIGVLFEVASLEEASAIRWRASFNTSPFTLGVAVAVVLNTSSTIVCDVMHIEDLGYRTMLGLEFAP